MKPTDTKSLPDTKNLSGTTSIVVGGGSGIGQASASAITDAGGKVILMGRDREKLERVASELGPASEVQPLDMTDQTRVDAVFGKLQENSIDHLIITASSAVHGPFADIETQKVEAMFDSKFFGPYRVAKAALKALKPGGSITFYAGVLSRRPGLNCSGLGAVNSAVEGLTRALALELGPNLRVNCISPGMVRSSAYSGLPPDKRSEMYRSTGESLPIGRVGETQEIATATLFALTCGYLTGQVIDVDGGHMVRQYATR